MQHDTSADQPTSRAMSAATEYVTVCDKWGVSGDYHEFAFGPARDKEGNFYITLNVGFRCLICCATAWIRCVLPRPAPP